MRYFFDVHDGTDAADEEGMECASNDAAIAEGARAACGMSVDIAGGGQLSVLIRDDKHTLAVVTVSVAIDRRR